MLEEKPMLDIETEENNGVSHHFIYKIKVPFICHRYRYYTIFTGCVYFQQHNIFLWASMRVEGCGKASYFYRVLLVFVFYFWGKSWSMFMWIICEHSGYPSTVHNQVLIYQDNFLKLSAFTFLSCYYINFVINDANALEISIGLCGAYGFELLLLMMMRCVHYIWCSLSHTRIGRRFID